MAKRDRLTLTDAERDRLEELTRYSTGNGNAPSGFSWSLAIPA